MAEAEKPPELLVLPSFIRSQDQVRDLIKEILQIEDFLYRSRVRQAGSKMTLPKTTPVLDKFAEANQRNVLNHTHRLELAKFLRNVYKQAPTISLLVSNDKNDALIDGIVDWFRTQVHAQALVSVVMQNQVGGGCMLRVKHKTYDFSLKKLFDDALPTLRESLVATPSANKPTLQRANYL